VYTIHHQTGEKILFQVLNHGSSFNFVDCMLEYYSLFQFETSERCSVLEIDRERLKYLSKSDDKLNDVLKELKAKMTIAGAKYDFSY